MKSSVKIGPSFFAKAKNDYSNWCWAWVRELAQNSMDAPRTTEINFEISLDEQGNTVAICRNNGAPMSQDILVNKFLALGESGKNFENSIGGFGKAKELIAFCHNSYSIHTGNHLVVGSGAEYELTETTYFHGTLTKVVIAGDCVDRLCHHVRKFGILSLWNGRFTLNGEVIGTDLRRGTLKRQFEFGKVYVCQPRSYTNFYANLLIVRIGGVPMFTEVTGFKKCIIVELNGTSGEVLTANRDGLTSKYAVELRRFVNELSVNKRSALRDRSQVRYRRFDGLKFVNATSTPSFNVASLVGSGSGSGPGALSAGIGTAAQGAVVVSKLGDSTESSGSGEVRPLVSVDSGVSSQVKCDFIVKNETELRIPRYYLPDSPGFSSYSLKLVKIWGKLMLELHRLFKREAVFSIGFAFDEHSEAQYESSSQFGIVYYLNPAKVVSQGASRSKSFKKRFSLTERNRILMLALHEFIHGVHDSHDEDYAAALTDMAAVVLDNRKRFNHCFS